MIIIRKNIVPGKGEHFMPTYVYGKEIIIGFLF